MCDIIEEYGNEMMARGEERGIVIGEARGEERGIVIGEARGEERGIVIGEARGEERGIKIGEARGEARSLVKSVKTLMLTMHMTVEQAMDALKVPEDRRSSIVQHVQ